LIAPSEVAAASLQRSLRRLLQEGACDVWTFPLSGDVLAKHCSVLSDDELARASKFVFDRDRHRYIQSRYCLRRLLGSYLRLVPAHVPIAIDANGKPKLDMNETLAFNLSHCRDRGVLAVARAGAGARVGVDIEWCNPETDVAAIAETVFSDDEIAALKALPQGEKRAAFFRCWTRKEAYLKAIGFGFATEARNVSVGVSPEALAVPGGAAKDAPSLTVQTLSSAEDFVISLAAPALCVVINQRVFSDESPSASVFA
jgi:4'-phosphopantetheinyl transferase